MRRSFWNSDRLNCLMNKYLLSFHILFCQSFLLVEFQIART